MATDSSEAAQILRGHDKRISELEKFREPEGPANIIRVLSDAANTADTVTTKVVTTTATRWDSADWAGSSDATTDMNWS